MKYKKIILSILFFVLFLGFYSNVEAKTIIGECKYNRIGNKGKETVTVTLYNDKSSKISGYSNLFLTANALSSMYDYGKCMPYMGIHDGFAGYNDVGFYYNDSFPNDKELHYILATFNSPKTCSYDFKYLNYNSSDTFVRINASIEENGSRVLIKSLDTSGNYGTLVEPGETSKVYWFAANRKNGEIIYDISKYNMLSFNLNIEDYNNLLDNMKNGLCPTLKYGIENSMDNGILYVNHYGEQEAISNGKYKINKDGKTEEKEDALSGSNGYENAKECITNGKTNLLGNKEKSFTFNFKIRLNNGIKQYCVQIDGGYSCTSETDPEAYKYSGVSTKSNSSEGVSDISFIIDDDLEKFIDNLSETNFSCPSTLYINNYSNAFYVISQEKMNDEATGLNEGENESSSGTGKTDYNEGQLVSGCEILGSKFMKYLKSVFVWIQILGPILALVLSMVDIMKAVASAEEDAKKKAFKSTKTRLLAAVILILLPFIIQLILSIADNINGTTCNL